MIVVMFLSMIIQNMLQSRFEKYSRVRTNSGMTGAEIARKMLADHGITDVKVTCIPGRLTDHYNPQTKTVNLSESVYNESSVAAAAVAAHECGHVVQHEKGYLPLKLRTALVPVVSFSSNIVQWVLLAGVLMVTMFHSYPVLIAGIVLFALTTLFSFVTLPGLSAGPVFTLPVEINASHRAVAWLENAGITNYETKPMAIDALKWAAYTYVVAAVGSLATLLYYISFLNDRR